MCKFCLQFSECRVLFCLFRLSIILRRSTRVIYLINHLNTFSVDVEFTLFLERHLLTIHLMLLLHHSLLIGKLGSFLTRLNLFLHLLRLRIDDYITFLFTLEFHCFLKEVLGMLLIDLEHDLVEFFWTLSDLFGYKVINQCFDFMFFFSSNCFADCTTTILQILIGLVLLTVVVDITVFLTYRIKCFFDTFTCFV